MLKSSLWTAWLTDGRVSIKPGAVLNDLKPFIWAKSADELFASMRKYLEPAVLESTCDREH
jgi:hypothetical protein